MKGLTWRGSAYGSERYSETICGSGTASAWGRDDGVCTERMLEMFLQNISISLSEIEFNEQLNDFKTRGERECERHRDRERETKGVTHGEGI
jgi:hypothetical protein